VRTVVACSIVIALFAVSCKSTPDAGPLEEGASLRPLITAVDTVRPPSHVWVQMDRPGYAALVLVAPGHSATLLYPRESFTSNELTAGAHQLTFSIPELLVQSDSARNARTETDRQRTDSSRRVANRRRARTTDASMIPLPPLVPTYFLLLTSPQPLSYQRLIEKTAGVSIPTLETEALNAVAKAIKSTLPAEPRELGGYYKRVELRKEQ
jgi:hypothetical protein